ncbi:arginine-tRNA ligase, cytoplasmic-like protein [Sarcoptes scabiei]|nr:arginine-tRNA ligase, cytoplasmic-like protein [Sarcoptes scabiei]
MQCFEKKINELATKTNHLLENQVLKPTIEEDDLKCLRSKNEKLRYQVNILKDSIKRLEQDSIDEIQMASPIKNDDKMLCINQELNCIFKKAIHKAFPMILNLTLSFQKSDFADFQCNNALQMTKLIPEKKKPIEIAQSIINCIEENELIENVATSGPGFININLKTDFIENEILNIILNGIQLNMVDENEDCGPVLVDYSSPNIAKEMHVGHLRSTIIGDCIARLLEFVGHKIVRINHIGDWGTQFGMLLAHLSESYPDFRDKPPSIENLQSFYKESKKRFDEEDDFKKLALETTVKLQSKDPDMIEAWKLICDISRKEFKEIYQILNIHENLIERGESFYQDRMIDVVKDLTDRNLLKEEEGRKIFYPNDRTIPPLTIVKSDGGFTYDTSDMAAIRQRTIEEKASRIIYTTDAGQSIHFKTLFDCAKIAGYYDPEKTRLDHLTFGVVLGEDKKRFKTRSGDTVKLKDLINEGLDRSMQKLLAKERDKVLTPEELKIAQKAIAIGCIKYSDLSHDRDTDYVFSFDRMLDDRGNTAVYLLYSLTRIRSIIRNCDLDCSTFNIALELKQNSSFKLNHPKELKLAKFILNFPDIIRQIVDDLYIHTLCRFMFDLSVVFNEFYDQCYVIEKIDSEKKINFNRIILCEATAKIMEISFQILGIETVEKM